MAGKRAFGALIAALTLPTLQRGSTSCMAQRSEGVTERRWRPFVRGVDGGGTCRRRLLFDGPSEARQSLSATGSKYPQALLCSTGQIGGKDWRD
jgi:hypothetical protein